MRGYIVTPVVRYDGETTDVRVIQGKSSTCRLVADGEKLIFSKASEEPDIRILEVEALTDFFVSMNCRVRAVVKNFGSEYVGKIQPKVRNSAGISNLDKLPSKFVVLEKDQSTTLEWNDKFSNLKSGDYSLYFTDGVAARFAGEELDFTIEDEMNLDLRIKSAVFGNLAGVTSVSTPQYSGNVHNVDRNLKLTVNLKSNVSCDQKLHAVVYPLGGSDYVDQIIPSVLLDKNSDNEIVFEKELSSTVTDGNIHYVSLYHSASGSSVTHDIKDQSGIAAKYYFAVVNRPTGIEIVKADTNCEISPNPAAGIVKVSTDATINRADVITMASASIPARDMQIDGTSATFNVSSLHPGIYIVRITSSSGIRIARLIKR